MLRNPPVMPRITQISDLGHYPHDHAIGFLVEQYQELVKVWIAHADVDIDSSLELIYKSSQYVFIRYTRGSVLGEGERRLRHFDVYSYQHSAAIEESCKVLKNYLHHPKITEFPSHPKKSI